MYNFSDFETIQALPDVVRIPELSTAIGLSQARTYQLLDEKQIPYIRIQRRMIGSDGTKNISQSRIWQLETGGGGLGSVTALGFWVGFCCRMQNSECRVRNCFI